MSVESLQGGEDHESLSDGICASFEAEWVAGGSPAIEDVLAEHPDLDHARLFHDLLAIDVEMRTEFAAPLQRDEYVARFPDYRDVIIKVFDTPDFALPPPPTRVGWPAGPEDVSTQVAPTADEEGNILLARGNTIGPYIIESKLAHGGMGVVYRARHCELGRVVALKTIRKDRVGSEAAMRRFRVEAQAAAGLDHPGIVPVYEVGEQDEMPFYAMAFVDGPSLSEVVKSEPLPSRRGANVCMRIAEAVEYAHQHGIVHRDLKPQNVLIDADGQPRVADFGLARSLTDDSELTKFGQILGTPAYMPPEQASGLGNQSGPVADVYSIGAILYRVLSGRAPFQAPTTIETLRQVIDQEAVPLRQLNSRIDRDLETICSKCLEKDPGRRYQSCGELAEDLECYLDARPIQAHPIGPIGRLVKWSQRRPLVAGLIMTVLLSMTAGTVISLKYAMQAEARAQDAIEILYVAQINRARQEYDSGNVTAAKQLLQSLIPEDNDATDLRGFEWHYLWRLCNNSLETFSIEGIQICSIAMSPDGKLLVAADTKSKQLVLWDVGTSEHHSSIPIDSSHVNEIAFSPDGRMLAIAANSGLLSVWQIESGERLHVLSGHSGDVRCVDFSSDGNRLVSGGGIESQPGEVFIWDLKTEQRVASLDGHSGRVEDVVFHPDDVLVASVASTSSSGPGEAVLWDGSSGQRLRTLGNEDLRCCDISPDGRWLAGGTWDTVDRVIFLWDVTTGEELHRLVGHNERTTSLDFNSDGTRLASASWDSTVRIWDPHTGRELLTIRGPDGPVPNPIVFAPDDRRIATFTSSAVEIWNAWVDPQPGPIRPIRELVVGNWHDFFEFKAHTHPIQTLDISNNGRFIATADTSPVARVWDVESRRLLHELAGHNGSIQSVAFSPDSQLLATGSIPSEKPGTGAGGIGIWNLENGELIRWLHGHTDNVQQVVFSPDSSRIVSIDRDKSFRVSDVSSGSSVFHDTLPDSVQSVAYSPDGKIVALAGMVSRDEPVSGWIELREANQFQRQRLIPVDWPVRSIAFHPDSRRIAVGAGHEVLEFDIQSTEPTFRMRGHTNDVTRVVYSPDGRRIISGAVDRHIRVWHAGRGLELLNLAAWDDWWQVSDVGMSPDGRQLFASGDAMLKIWDSAPPSAQTQVERDAVSLLHYLRVHAGLKSKIIESIRDDMTIRRPVRERALVIADHHQDHEATLWRLSYPIALSSRKTRSEYDESLRFLQRAFEVNPDAIYVQAMLAIALYRTGDFSGAIELIKKYEQTSADGSRPRMDELAILTMAYLKTGKSVQAHKYLQRLEEAMSKGEPPPQWLLELVREARILINADESDE